MNSRSLTAVSQVLSSLAAVQSQEADISSSLSILLSSQQPIVDSLDKLQSLLPRLEEASLDVRLLSEKVTVTSETAQRVGARVRTLDEEISRLRESTERVGQVMELSSSLRLLDSAMKAKDYDTATRHCARAMLTPQEVIKSQFAETVIPSSEWPELPADCLQKAREELLHVFIREFEEGARSRDAAKSTRFFKLFPAIGWENEGLEAYSRFVVDLVRERPPLVVKASSPAYYITVVTALFEHVAHIIDQHQPIVRRHYGNGKMIFVVAKLLSECEKILSRYLSGWEEERDIQRKVAQITPSTLKMQSGAQDEPLLDVRDVDQVVSEIAGLAGRWSLFYMFLKDRLEGHGPDDDSMGGTSHYRNDELDRSWSVPHSAGCRNLFEKLLEGYYLNLDAWYFRFIVNRALRQAKVDYTVHPPVTTTPDDVFYALKLILTRILSTGCTVFVQKALNRLRNSVDHNFINVMKEKLDDVYAGASATTGGIRSEKLEKDNRTTFATLLNDLDVASSHMEQLMRETLQSPFRQRFLESDVPLIETEIRAFTSNVQALRGLVKGGIQQLFNQLLRPRLRQVINDVYKDITYVLREDTYVATEYEDAVPKRFMKSWSILLDPFKTALTDINYLIFFTSAVDVTVRLWEKTITNMKFTEFGAIRLDHDIRSILAYLSSQTTFGDAREKFQRLQQISTLLNLDKDEKVEEFYDGSGLPWAMTLSEAQSFMDLKL